MSLSAADLERRHKELEGAPDPFPSLNGTSRQSEAKAPATSSTSVEVDSESAFPSLAPSSAPAPTKPSAWGASGARSNGIKAKAVKAPAPVHTHTFTLDKVELGRGADGKFQTMGNVIKEVMTKTKTKIEASTQKGSTTFRVKGETERALNSAIRHITASLSPQVTLIVNAPLSTIGTIIGPKGANLNRLRDATGGSVKIDVPKRETAPAAAGGEDDDEPTLPISITGPSSLAEDVRADIYTIVSVKTSQTTQRVRSIPANVFPFILFNKADYASGHEDAIKISFSGDEAIVSGDRQVVEPTIAAIQTRVKELTDNLESFSMTLPKRQHRLLTGAAAADLMKQTRCAIIPTAPDVPGDEVVIWGASDDISAALGQVYQKAKSKHTLTVPFPGSFDQASLVQRYLSRSDYFKDNVSSKHPKVDLHLAPVELSNLTQTVYVDVVSEDKQEAETVAKSLKDVVQLLSTGLRALDIHWLMHKTLQGRFRKNLQTFYDERGVLALFPAELSQDSTVILVADPASEKAASLGPADRQKELKFVEDELLRFVSESGDFKSETITVDNKWHNAIIGKSGSTLNAIIGEDRSLSITFGSQRRGAQSGSQGPNEIVIQGTADEVARATQEIQNIAEKAKTDEIDNGYSIEFEIVREYVSHIVGAGGASINKLRDQLGVNVDFIDDRAADEKESSGDAKKKKKSASNSKTKVKIVGRQVNVEEAKKRILAQVEKMADETTEILKIARGLHAGLIGQGGKYVIRLEEKYAVRILFPREAASEEGEDESKPNRHREALKQDEVLLRGGKKGVAGAKAEIMEAVEYEKDSSHSVSFTVPTSAVARILGRGGATINAIKDETTTQIDVDKAGEGGGKQSNITITGSKKSIAAAKEAILAISDKLSDEVTVVVSIDSRFHRNVIGAGGQNLRDLVSKAGGPSDPRAQAGLVHFPRQGEAADEVRLRGPSPIVEKLKVALEALAAEFADRVIVGVAVPAAKHRILIGRNGQTLMDLQSRTQTTIQFPGSRTYESMGAVSNADELNDAAPGDIVKISGSSSAAAKAVAELLDTAGKSSEGARSSEPKGSKGPAATGSVSIPLKYTESINTQPNLFRNLRSKGITVTAPSVPKTSGQTNGHSNGKAAPARIDDESALELEGVEWSITSNFEGAPEGDGEWALRARDEEGIEEGRKVLLEALETVSKSTHVGTLKMQDRSAFPRIVGTRGANVAKLRDETGADIQVGRDTNHIVIKGSVESIEAAKAAILKIAEPRR